MQRSYSFLAILVLCASGCAGTSDDAVILGDFESGTDSWVASENTKIESIAEHASRGKHALKVQFGTESYPGVGLVLGDADWSNATAIRVSVFNPTSETIRLPVRIDDVESTDYGTRYNLDAGLPVKPGQNELEVTVASMKIGTLGSRGLDVRHIRELRFFLGNPEKPVTLYFDDVRTVPRKKMSVGYVRIMDLCNAAEGTSHLADGTASRVVATPRKPRALELTLTPKASYPGIGFTGMRVDWLNYDTLDVTLVCPDDRPAPERVSIKIVAADGTKQTFATGLTKGRNELALPLDVAGFTSLGNVSELQIFFSKPQADQTVTLESVMLDSELIDQNRFAGTLRPEAQADDPLQLDFSGMKEVGRNTCFGGIVWTPMRLGNNVYYANAPGGGPLTYGWPHEMKYVYPNTPINVWGFFLDHGVWHWTHQSVSPKQPTPIVIRFDDPKAFGR